MVFKMQIRILIFWKVYGNIIVWDSRVTFPGKIKWSAMIKDLKIDATYVLE